MTMLVLLKSSVWCDDDSNDNVVVIIAACGRRRGKDNGKRGDADNSETTMTETTATMKMTRRR
jgi:hypothetical protein